MSTFALICLIFCCICICHGTLTTTHGLLRRQEKTSGNSLEGRLMTSLLSWQLLSGKHDVGVDQSPLVDQHHRTLQQPNDEA